MAKENKTKVFVLYTMIFFALWTLCEMVVFQKLESLIENKVLYQLVGTVLIKNLVWTVPAALLICYFKQDVYVSLREMFSAQVHWLRYLPVFIGFTVYLLGGAMLQKGKLAISNDFGFDDVIVLLFVGITEELVFRGWLLNFTLREEKKWRCILINAILFLAIHFPVWIRQGEWISNFTSLGFLCVFGLSIIFSWTFVKSKSIIVPVALHTYWDLFMYLFY